MSSCADHDAHQKEFSEVKRPDPKGVCQVFVSYSHVDEADRVRLDVHLAPLAREGLIDLWCSRAITPGSDWERDIESELAASDICILLVSADFIASMFCFEKELAEALRRHRQDGLRILPVLIKPADFANMPFGRFQTLPRDLRPISTWENPDAAWVEVARGVRETVDDVNRSRIVVPGPRRSFDGNSGQSLLGQELSSYYGTNCCVVDGTIADDRDVEWIPLEEGAESMRFDNLVPISKRHRMRPNHVDEEHSQRVVFRFGIDLIAERLIHSARRHFHAGAPALAFGCTRLGDILAVNYPYAFETHEGDDWAFLAQSLFYLPYRMHAALLAATMVRVRRRLKDQGTCPTAGRTALMIAIANLYQDVGRWAKAERLYDEVLKSRLSPFLHVTAVRRRALGQLLDGAGYQEMDREFRSISQYRMSSDHSVSLALSRAWWHLAHRYPERCLGELAPFDFDEGDPCAAPTYSPHNAIELKLTQASALAMLGLNHKSLIQFVAKRAEKAARLRQVFTEHIAPLVLAPQLQGVLHGLRGVPVDPASLDETAATLLATRGGRGTGRPIWVD